VFLQVVTSDNPDFRYIVGNDAAMTLEARRNMSEEEFKKLIKKQLNLKSVGSLLHIKGSYHRYRLCTIFLRLGMI
jgi:hypothetical protein